METVIGFAVGYLVGTQHGREGFAKIKESIEAIRTSPEVREMVTAGAAMAGEMVRKVLKGDAGAMLSDMVDSIMPRTDERQVA